MLDIIHRKTDAFPGGMVLKLYMLTHLRLLEFNALIPGDVFTRIDSYIYIYKLLVLRFYLPAAIGNVHNKKKDKL